MSELRPERPRQQETPVRPRGARGLRGGRGGGAAESAARVDALAVIFMKTSGITRLSNLRIVSGRGDGFGLG